MTPHGGYPGAEMEAASEMSSVAVAEQPQSMGTVRDQPVVVTGAAGLVGTHVCRTLVNSGFKVRAVVRDMAKAASRFGHLPIEIRVSDIRNADSMRAALTGAGSLIHLAAIAIEKPGQSYADVNTDATRILLDAAKSAGANRIVYMSQNGADAGSRYAFLRSKGIAQEMVAGSGSRWTVLRPSVIFGPEDEFVNVLGRMVKLSPLVFPLPGGGTAKFQPVAVGDVARAVVKVLADPESVGRTWSLGGSTPLTLRQMTERILIAMNTSRVLVGVPVTALRPVVALAQKVLPHPPVTTGLLDLLEIDNVIDKNDLTETLGITPTPFAPEELLYLRKITVSSAIKSLFG
ncbi:MAG: complex I NDUFA9 subunit family protein [Gemmatimonadaceae bacterium]|nr:complex I NDUFA9 subunit family protein [Gemmatimonadaceae bacterium]